MLDDKAQPQERQLKAAQLLGKPFFSQKLASMHAGCPAWPSDLLI